MTDDRWRSPLGSRYASPAMQTLWGEPHRIGLWRRLWLALAEAERELGLDIPERGARPDARAPRRRGPRRRDRYERRFRHDVMAHIHAFGDQAPAARPYLHLGATSAFVTDNADLVVMRDGLRLLLGRLIAVLAALEEFARRYGATCPASAYTHFQPAQLTTVGKRATLWMQDFALDVEEIAHRLDDAAASAACKGTTGTQASSSSSSAATTPRCASSSAGSRPSSASGAFAVTGQTYTRRPTAWCSTRSAASRSRRPSWPATSACSSTRASCSSRSSREQIGSCAMAYKRNPMRAERIAGLARFVISLQANAAHTRRDPVARAHARRQRQPPAALPGGVPRRPTPFWCSPTNIAGRARGPAGAVIRRHVAERAAVHGHRALAHARASAPAATGRTLHEVHPAAQHRGRGAREHGARPQRPARPAGRRPGVRRAGGDAAGRARARRASSAARREQVDEFLERVSSQPLLGARRAARRRAGGAEVRV